ncbi:gag-pol polyprotein [Tanacetum coccineum]
MSNNLHLTRTTYKNQCQNPKDISDPTTATNIGLVLMAKAFKQNNTTPTNNNQRSSSNPRNRQIAQLRQIAGNQNGYNAVQNVGNQIRCYNCQGVGHYARNCTIRPMRRDAAYLQSQLQIAQNENARIQLKLEEFDLMAATGAYEEIEEVNANCTLMENLQQASTSGTQANSDPVYDSDGSVEVHKHQNYYNNDIFNMFTQKEQDTDLLESTTEPHLVQHNDSNVIPADSSMDPSRGTVEQPPATVEEAHAFFESLYNNLLVYQEQCLANLNNQLSKEKSTVSYLQEEKKKLKDDLKTREDELLDKLIQSEKKIKELDNILGKTG